MRWENTGKFYFLRTLVVSLGYGFYYQMEHHLSFAILEKMNNFKQIEEQNESPLNDVFCELVNWVRDDMKIINLE
jgi:hypothetical protein